MSHHTYTNVAVVRRRAASDPPLAGLVAKMDAPEAAQVSDVELLRRISWGDRKALAVLYDRYAPTIFRLIMTMVRKQEDGEDLLHEIFLQIWNKAPLFNEQRGSAYSWISTLARHRAIDRIRSKHARLQNRHLDDFDFETVEDDDPHTPLETISAAERAELLRNAFAKISTKQREVLQMAYFEGYSQSQIACALQLPLGTVKTRAREGMKKLHRLLQNRL